jgi:hypothetical protein
MMHLDRNERRRGSSPTVKGGSVNQFQSGAVGARPDSVRVFNAQVQFHTGGQTFHDWLPSAAR